MEKERLVLLKQLQKSCQQLLLHNFHSHHFQPILQDISNICFHKSTNPKYKWYINQLSVRIRDMQHHSQDMYFHSTKLIMDTHQNISSCKDTYFLYKKYKLIMIQNILYNQCHMPYMINQSPKILTDKLKDKSLSKGILKFDFEGMNCMKSKKNMLHMGFNNQNSLYFLKDMLSKDRFQNRFHLEHKEIYLLKSVHTLCRNFN